MWLKNRFMEGLLVDIGTITEKGGVATVFVIA